MTNQHIEIKTMEQNERRKWVKGNTLPLAVPLCTKTAVDGEWVMADYFPPEGSVINVSIAGTFKCRQYTYELDGNVVRFTDDGSLPVGDYGIEIVVREPSNTNRRTFNGGQIRICNDTDEIGMLPDGEMLMDAAIFIQGEPGPAGPAGPPGTTDYNELANKPDLSVFAEGVTQEQFNEIFT